MFINIKKFQANMYLYFEKMPIILTKREKPFAVLSKFKGDKKDKKNLTSTK